MALSAFSTSLSPYPRAIKATFTRLIGFYLGMLIVCSRISSHLPPLLALNKSLFQSRNVPIALMALLVCDVASCLVGKCSIRRLERVTPTESNITLFFKTCAGPSYYQPYSQIFVRANASLLLAVFDYTNVWFFSSITEKALASVLARC